MYGDLPEKNGFLASCILGPLKVIGTDTYWLATCDFLFVIHNKHGRFVPFPR